MNITEVLEEAQVPFCPPGSHHHVREGWVGIDCPWCPTPIGDKGRWRLGIETSTGRCNCWVCGGHSITNVLTALGVVSRVQAPGLLQRLKFKKVYLEAKRGRLELPKGVGPLQKHHRDYLRSRDLKPNEIEGLWKVKGLGITRHLSWSLFIPVHMDGQMVSWTTRRLGEGGSYINARPDQEDVPIKNTLYGADLVRSTAIICEGPADAWKIGPGAVATFGVQMSTAQIKMMHHFPRRVILLDSDAAGVNRGRFMADWIGALPGETFYVQLDADDPGSASRRELNRLRRMFL